MWVGNKLSEGDQWQVMFIYVRILNTYIDAGTIGRALTISVRIPLGLITLEMIKPKHQHLTFYVLNQIKKSL